MDAAALGMRTHRFTPEAVQTRLLDWYDRHRRRLPWRALPGETPDPYAVWLSEIMLQQTTVAAVKPYFEAFLGRWPSVADLAAAPQEEVLTAWAGLGYYARARNLHACAMAVTERHGGRFPDSETALRDLPGIGPYTAAAIAAIAFDRPATPLDGNIERVTARLFAVTEPLPGVKPNLQALAATLTPQARPGDFAQAEMDLGATICLPRTPKCLLCPLEELCAARAAGLADQLPRKAPKAAKPTRRGVAFWLTRSDGAVLLRRRPPKGLLGGMTEVPSSDWTEAGPGEGEAAGAAPTPVSWQALPGLVRHTFTHFHLELTVWTGRLESGEEVEGFWVPLEGLAAAGLPSVMRKVAKHAIKLGV
ncbi:A/G-specific adenine glycosylase [Algihabitans albus]|uniref:A/G-specific adenine glycosylase n=1 Tax=Algihabitans albus TaxID=2164067 RepID=UPI000E5D381E|nr:A/G-specific adenine glycosylase [Algihabitans albus]